MKKHIMLIALIVAICTTLTSCAKKENHNQSAEDDAAVIEETVVDKDAESEPVSDEKQSTEIACKTNEPVTIDGKIEIEEIQKRVLEKPEKVKGVVTKESVDEMKLRVYEAHAEGIITEAEKDTYLEYLNK